MDLADGLAVLDAAQRGVLALLAAVGAVGEVHGQPAWPFAQRVAIETLAIDRALTRALVGWLVFAALAVVALAIGGVWKRWRWPAWGAAALALLVAPWPAPSLVLAPAVPTSFHRSPTGFSAAAIVRGEGLYRRHCAECHGNDGRGEGPRAASLAMWPPDLTGALLWRRHDGELLWRVLHGVNDYRGRTTMPGFAGVLDADAAWALLDFLQAQAAGETLRRDGVWARPVRPPGATVRCADGRKRALRDWQGQRLRIVVGSADPAARREDPRFHTISIGAASACTIEDEHAAQAFARVAGVPPAQLAGMQFLVDRRGWLRARSVAGQGGWSEADLVCRAASTPADASRGAAGLDMLLARMEAEPVSDVRGGLTH